MSIVIITLAASSEKA